MLLICLFDGIIFVFSGVVCVISELSLFVGAGDGLAGGAGSRNMLVEATVSCVNSA